VADHTALHLEAIVRSLRSGRPVTREDLIFVRAPTTRRARRQIPLGDYLHAFRIGHRFIWRTLISGADDDQSRAAALTLVEPVIEFINIVSTHVAEVYVEVEQLLLARGERVRRDLLDDLLAARRPPLGPRDEARRAASIEADGTHVVLTARPDTTDVDEHALHAAAAALGRTGATATMPLSVLRGEEIVAIVPAAPAQAPALSEAVRIARVKLAEQGMPLTIGASTIVTGLEQLPAAYREACDARTIAAKHGGVLCLCALDAFDCLTLLGNETASRLIAPHIASFVSDDLANGGVLTTTLLEYAAADLNAKVAAEHLYIHVNTAYHRLGRIAERTGRDLRSLNDVIDLMIAIKLAQSHGSS
jgi:sugar diacid utilization regulator